MAKKYVPSGYQIINIDCSDKTSETPFDPITEDEKLLFKIINDKKFDKPILLNVIDSSGILWTGFGVIHDVSIILSLGQSLISFYISSGQLVYYLYEE